MHVIKNKYNKRNHRFWIKKKKQKKSCMISESDKKKREGTVVACVGLKDLKLLNLELYRDMSFFYPFIYLI